MKWFGSPWPSPICKTCPEFRSQPGSYASIAEKRLRRRIPELSIPIDSLRIATVFFGSWQVRPKAILQHDQAASGGSQGPETRKPTRRSALLGACCSSARASFPQPKSAGRCPDRGAAFTAQGSVPTGTSSLFQIPISGGTVGASKQTRRPGVFSTGTALTKTKAGLSQWLSAFYFFSFPFHNSAVSRRGLYSCSSPRQFCSFTSSGRSCSDAIHEPRGPPTLHNAEDAGPSAAMLSLVHLQVLRRLQNARNPITRKWVGHTHRNGRAENEYFYADSRTKNDGARL
jgi:hypothetical protein